MTDATADAAPLETVYRGWDGYNTSLVRAVAPLTPEQLRYRPAPGLRSAGEIARHISGGRLTWFLRMNPPGGAELAARVPAWDTDAYGNRYVNEDALADAADAPALVEWLEATWEMVAATLRTWTVADRETTYRHTYRGQTYAVSRQWTIWRIMAHDIQHGGQLTVLLYLQGIEPLELGLLGGHLTEPPLADAAVEGDDA
jgi:uncharacterized damage-inducible protein DinB